MNERKYVYNDWENLKREHDQRSGAEVPGFHVRTVIDDTIGKLFALRQQLKDPLPDGFAALLDDVEEMVESAIEIGLDFDAPEINDGEAFRAPELMNHSDHLAASASTTVAFCSCGRPTL